MGVHQYQIEVLPRSATDAELESGEVWREPPPAAFLDLLRDMLAVNSSWGGVEEFESGNAWGSDLRIWHDEEIETPVFSIVFRFSPVADDLTLLDQFLGYVAKFDLALYSKETRTRLEPVMQVVEQDMRKTRAFRFLSDPEGAVIEAAQSVGRGRDESDGE